MNKEELNQLHNVMLLIMDEIDRICRKNNIKYSLTGGSLIGAIRHGGFIPWDDDMDVGMLREEYERFIAACEYDLDSRFELQTIWTDPYYFLGFGKILLKNTYVMEHGSERSKRKRGIYVDIFPFDNIPSNLKLQRKHKWTNYLYIKMLSRKSKTSIKDKGIVKIILFHCLDILNIFVSSEDLVKRLNDNMLKYDGSDTELVCCMAGYYGYEKEKTYRSYFEDMIDVAFEDRRYLITKEYDQYLTGVYGNYMELPPVEKRRTHGFAELDFGPYADEKNERNSNCTNAERKEIGTPPTGFESEL